MRRDNKVIERQQRAIQWKRFRVGNIQSRGEDAMFLQRFMQRIRRGRQEAYLIGTWYEEIIVERLFDGKTQLNTALQPIMEAAEQVLELDEHKRQRTIVRIDSGGGQSWGDQWAAGQRLSGAC